MNKRNAYSLGYDRGQAVASWQDMPAIGSTLPCHVDYVGIGPILNVGEQIDAWHMLCSDAESNGRDFSPFEFTAHEFNESRDPEGMWAAFDAGIEAGIRAYRRKHFPLAKLRRAARREVQS